MATKGIKRDQKDLQGFKRDQKGLYDPVCLQMLVFDSAGGSMFPSWFQWSGVFLAMTWEVDEGVQDWMHSTGDTIQVSLPALHDPSTKQKDTLWFSVSSAKKEDKEKKEKWRTNDGQVG